MFAPSSPAESTDPRQQDALWQRYVHNIRTRSDISFEEQYDTFKSIFRNRGIEDGPPLVWQPSDKHLRESNLANLMHKTGNSGYDRLHQWTAQHREEFWREAISALNIRFKKQPQKILDLSAGITEPRWLPGARLNCVDSCFNAPPEKTAVISAREGSGDLLRTTYSDLEKLVNQVANGLQRAKFKAGDGIALYMPMNLQCVAAYLGIIRSGCRVVSIADSFSAAELEKRLKMAHTEWIITVESYRRGGRTIALYDKIKETGLFRAIVIPSEDTSGSVTLRKNDMLWNDFLSPETEYQSLSHEPSSVINLLFSSGTTGTPKIIPWTHLTPVKAAMDGRFHQDIHATDVVAWPTNIGWMMGPWLIFASLINEAAMALYEGSPLEKGFMDFISDAAVTVLGVIPSLVRAWRASGVMEQRRWEGIKCFSSTGEPSATEDYLWLMSRTGYRAPVIEYLGGTEIGGGHITGSIVKPASPATFNTPALGLDFVLLDDQGQRVKENETGELYIIPPSIGLSQTLLNKDHHLEYYANCPAGPDGQILRRHGDRFLKLPNGFYKAQGRADDAMNLGGIKVSSIELEQVINQHPAIEESAAVSVQLSGEGEEKLTVFAVMNSEIDGAVLKQDLNSLLAKNLNPLFKILDIVFVDRLPRTASNKVMRRKLRSMYQEKSQRST